MKVEKNKVVSVNYILRSEENGPVVEQTKDGHLPKGIYIINNKRVVIK